jgi:hypothetical protein
MSLKGRILPGYGDHRRRIWRRYARYCRAVQARYESLGSDGLHWLREAGLLVVALDAIHLEEEATRQVLTNGTRRTRAKARTTLGRLERRAARLRASLEAAERRVEALAAQPTGSGRGDPLAAVRQAVEDANRR